MRYSIAHNVAGSQYNDHRVEYPITKDVVLGLLLAAVLLVLCVILAFGSREV